MHVHISSAPPDVRASHGFPQGWWCSLGCLGSCASAHLLSRFPGPRACLHARACVHARAFGHVLAHVLAYLFVHASSFINARACWHPGVCVHARSWSELLMVIYGLANTISSFPARANPRGGEHVLGLPMRRSCGWACGIDVDVLSGSHLMPI